MAYMTLMTQSLSALLQCYDKTVVSPIISPPGFKYGPSGLPFLGYRVLEDHHVPHLELVAGGMTFGPGQPLLCRVAGLYQVSVVQLPGDRVWQTCPGTSPKKPVRRGTSIVLVGVDEEENLLQFLVCRLAFLGDHVFHGANSPLGSSITRAVIG